MALLSDSVNTFSSLPGSGAAGKVPDIPEAESCSPPSPPSPAEMPSEARLLQPLRNSLAAEKVAREAAIKAGTTPNPGFFTRNITPRAEIVQGTIREGQLVTLAGRFNVGKSPLLQDLTVHIVNGLPWCGRLVQKQPVVIFDLESAGPTFKGNLTAIAQRLGVPLPQVPQELEIYLEHDAIDEPATAQLLKVLESNDLEDRLAMIEGALKRKPNAVVVIDPLELLFRIDTSRKAEVLGLYSKLRLLLSKYPHAAMVLTFNLRKRDKKAPISDLLSEPRDWMEEVCGSLDLMNRSDVRLGIDVHDDDIRVINGLRRGETMEPLLIRPVSYGSELAGFELVAADTLTLQSALTPTQYGQWNKLPGRFRFNEAADKIVPRKTLARIVSRTKSLGALRDEGGVYAKSAPAKAA